MFVFYVSSTLCQRSTFVLRWASVQEHEGRRNGRQQSDKADRYALRGLFAFQSFQPAPCLSNVDVWALFSFGVCFGTTQEQLDKANTFKSIIWRKFMLMSDVWFCKRKTNHVEMWARVPKLLKVMLRFSWLSITLS